MLFDKSPLPYDDSVKFFFNNHNTVGTTVNKITLINFKSHIDLYHKSNQIQTNLHYVILNQNQLTHQALLIQSLPAKEQLPLKPARLRPVSILGRAILNLATVSLRLVRLAHSHQGLGV